MESTEIAKNSTQLQTHVHRPYSKLGISKKEATNQISFMMSHGTNQMIKWSVF